MRRVIGCGTGVEALKGLVEVDVDEALVEVFVGEVVVEVLV